MPEAMNENKDINVSKKSHPLLFSLIFFTIAIVLCVISVSEFLIYKQKNENFIEVIGKIVDYNSDKDDRLRAIIAEYEVDGQKYELNSKKYVDIPDSIGSVVSIKYNPDNPSEAIFTYEKPGFTFIAISFGVLFISIIKLISSIRKKYKKEEPKKEEKPEEKEKVEEPPVVQQNHNIKSFPDQQTLGQLRQTPLPNNESIDNQE